MALITCPDCGKQVSDQATSCIGCGRPLRAAPAKQPTAGSAKATEKGVQRAKWKYDLGNAIGGIGVAIGIVVMIAHRPSVMAIADKLMVIEDGSVSQYGPRTDVIEMIMPGVRAVTRRPSA